MSLLKVEDLQVYYDSFVSNPGEGDLPLFLSGENGAVRGISFAVEPGECVGIVGESGSGKSSVMRAVMGLLPASAKVSFKAITIGPKVITGIPDEAQMSEIRGKAIAMVFQDPAACLNPTRTVGKQLIETIRKHRPGSYQAAREEAVQLLQMVRIRDPWQQLLRYPFELSGGMRQRVALAIALACKPKLLIADEPTTALDATVRRQILELLRRIAEETKMAVIMVTHDLNAAAAICQRIMVMKDGWIVEDDDVYEIFKEPKHPYTKVLVKQAKVLGRGGPKPVGGEVLLETKALTKLFKRQHNWFWEEHQEAVREVSLQIRTGEIYGIVGESGSGKTTLARMIAGLTRPSSGEILYQGVTVDRQHKNVVPQIQMVFQHSGESLNPRFSVREILDEPLHYLTGIGKAERAHKITDMLKLVGLKESDQMKYPHQFSGGQKQRINIARALIAEPKLVICDEPVASLDAFIQAQILDLLKDIGRQRRLSYLFISHDLNVIRYMSQRVGVMLMGRMVESGDTEAVYKEPWHPYTQELLLSVLAPVPGKRKGQALLTAAAEANNEPESACPYYSRCGYKMARCKLEKPVRYRFDEREVACFLYSAKHSGSAAAGGRMTAKI